MSYITKANALKIITNEIDNPAINNWQKNEIENSKVMPKSGWRIIKPAKRKKAVNTKYIDILWPCTPLLKNHALTIKKNGLRNSDGCILIAPILNHLEEPLISLPMNKIKINIMKHIITPNKANLLKVLIFWVDK